MLEQLESRCVMSGVQPTAQEQLLLEQLNDIRANPAAYGSSINLPAVASVSPAPPLAFNSSLIQAAEGHSQDMNANNYFGHYDQAGHDPGWRESHAGFAWTDYGESIAAGYATDAQALQALIVDAGVPDLGHRLHLLAMNNSDESVGIGVVQNGTGTYSDYYTIDTGNTSDTRPYLTGVVYNDAAHTGKYAIGEGLSGVTITVAGNGSVQAYDTGGYSIQLNPGTYTVTASGGQLAAPITQVVTIGNSNVRLNFTPQGTQLNNLPTNLLQIANEFTHSPESFTNFVTNAYQDYLKRNPTSPELSYWVNRMGQGMSDEQIEASSWLRPGIYRRPRRHQFPLDQRHVPGFAWSFRHATRDQWLATENGQRHDRNAGGSWIRHQSRGRGRTYQQYLSGRAGAAGEYVGS